MTTARALLGALLCLCTVVGCSPPTTMPAMATAGAGARLASTAPVPEPRAGADPRTTPEPTASQAAAGALCDLPTVMPPTPPAVIPGYAELDPATGLHVTGGAEAVDLATYELLVTGRVAHPQRLTYDALRCLPRLSLRCTLVCPGYFEDDAEWAGARLSAVLDMAGVLEGASGLKLKSADGYVTLVSLRAARAESALLAYEWEGQPVPILHGFPLRAVFPDLEGNRWAKWLVEIEIY